MSSIRLHILTTLTARFLMLGGSFIGGIFLARSLGPEGLGIVTAFMVVPNLLISLAELGLRQSAAHQIGKGGRSMAEVASALMSLWLLTSLVAIALVFPVLLFQGLLRYGLFCLLITTCITPFTLVSKYTVGIALGLQHIPRVNLGENILAGARLLAILILVAALGYGVQGALLAEILAASAAAGYWLVYLARRVPLRFSTDVALQGALVKNGFKYALALFVTILNYRANILILQHYVPSADIGLFAIGLRMSELVWVIPSALGMVVFSHSTGAGDSRTFALRTAQIMRMTFVLCCMGTIVIFMFCGTFISILFGEKFLPSVPLVRIMLPGITAVVIFKVLHADLAGRGYPLVAMWVFGGGAILNIILNLALVSRYGVYASAWSSSISYILIVIAYVVVYTKLSGITLRHLLFQPHDDWALLKKTLATPFRKGGR